MTAMLLSLTLTLGAAPPADLTVMSYNVNFGGAGSRSTIRAIAKGRADVVLLQETNGRWERAIRKRLKRRYKHMLFRHCCRAGGLAVLSRFPLKDVAYLDAPTGWFPGWIVNVKAPGGTVQTLNVHLRPPVDDRGSWISGYFTTHGSRLKELRHYTAKLAADLPTIIAGDFNEARGPSLDLLLGRGMRNALHEHAPDTPTWRWPSPIGELSQQLDHVFFTPHFDARRARVLDAGRSDHYPVVVELNRVPIEAP